MIVLLFNGLAALSSLVFVLGLVLLLRFQSRNLISAFINFCILVLPVASIVLSGFSNNTVPVDLGCLFLAFFGWSVSQKKMVIFSIGIPLFIVLIYLYFRISLLLLPALTLLLEAFLLSAYLVFEHRKNKSRMSLLSGILFIQFSLFIAALLYQDDLVEKLTFLSALLVDQFFFLFLLYQRYRQYLSEPLIEKTRSPKTEPLIRQDSSSFLNEFESLEQRVTDLQNRLSILSVEFSSLLSSFTAQIQGTRQHLFGLNIISSDDNEEKVQKVNISDILEDIHSKGKISSSGIVNLSSIMDSANRSLEKSETLVVDIRRNLSSIDSVTVAIDGISAQAHVLAMNAAIESAVTGDQREGFLVVAADLRLLTERIRKQTIDIHRILEEVLKNLERGNKSTMMVSDFFSDMQQVSEKIFEYILKVVNLSMALTQTAKNNEESEERLPEVRKKCTDLENSLKNNLKKWIEQIKLLEISVS